MPILMFGSWVLNEIYLSSALVGMLMSSSKLFHFSNKAHLNSGVALLLRLYRAKSLATMAFTFAFLDVIVVLDLNKNIGGSTGLAKKRRKLADMYILFTHPYHNLVPRV